MKENSAGSIHRERYGKSDKLNAFEIATMSSRTAIPWV